MLHWFPAPYPDELLYSVLARYHVRSGNTSPKMTTEELFGNRTVRSVLDLPANMNTLVKRIGSYWSADTLIYNHTMFSYYAAFLLPNQAKQVKQSMVDDRGSTIHTRIGAAASNVKPKANLWVCNDCINEDMDTFGETYWHRIHQVPCVFVCPKHEVVLEETTLSTKAKNQHEYEIATPIIDRTRVNLDGLQKEEFQFLLKIAQITETLLTNSQLQTQDNTLREKYQILLKQKGYAGLNGFLRRDRLYQSFTAKFSTRILELLQSPIIFDETDWLTMIFQKHRKSFHPVRHMLIMLFLETNLDHLYNQEQYHPFGYGPWLCLNTACRNHLQPVITTLTITTCYDTRLPVGTFRCDCGFVFSRRGPDQNMADKYCIGTIKEYGEFWKARLTFLVNKGKRLTQIINELQADQATIKKYAAEIGLKVPWKAPKIKTENVKIPMEDYEMQLTKRKDKWLELQELYPQKSKTEIRKMAPDVYTFLYRHDPEWLNDYSPIKKRIQTPNKRVDWGKRDKELLKMVTETVQDWDKNTVKPTKITMTSISRKINRLSLFEKKADKLPRMMKFINMVVEDEASFQKRRVEFTIAKLIKDGEPIIEWQIYKKAGLRPTVSDEVKRYITLKITEYDTVNK